MLRPNTFALTALLALLTGLAPLSMDMYLPSLPDIGRVKDLLSRCTMSDMRERFVAQILDEQLAEARASQGHGLLKHPGRAELARRDIQFDGAPGRTRQQHDLFEQRRRPATQGHEGDTHLFEASEIGVGGELGVKD